MNAREALNNVNNLINAMEVNEGWKYGYGNRRQVKIWDVCNDLGIFDWWNEYLSISQLKQMKKFLERSIGLGFEGYVCFKVGAKYCSHGMWSHKEESTTGHSPNGDCLFHSFRAGERYWCSYINGEWNHNEMNFKQVKKIVEEAK